MRQHTVILFSDLVHANRHVYSPIQGAAKQCSRDSNSHMKLAAGGILTYEESNEREGNWTCFCEI